MGYQAILNALKADRKAADVSEEQQCAGDTADAKRFFGGDLTLAPGHTFVYTKTGRKHVYQKNKDVATRWLKLLEDREDIRAAWLSMSSAMPPQ